MKKAYDWLKLAENSTSRKDCTLLCSNVGYLVLKLYYYHINKGPFTVINYKSIQKCRILNCRIQNATFYYMHDPCRMKDKFGSW